MFAGGLRNYINNTRRLRMDATNADSIRKVFLEMQMKSEDFFHLTDNDSQGKLRNVIWVHP